MYTINNDNNHYQGKTSEIQGNLVFCQGNFITKVGKYALEKTKRKKGKLVVSSVLQ